MRHCQNIPAPPCLMSVPKCLVSGNILHHHHINRMIKMKDLRVRHSIYPHKHQGEMGQFPGSFLGISLIWCVLNLTCSQDCEGCLYARHKQKVHSSGIRISLRYKKTQREDCRYLWSPLLERSLYVGWQYYKKLYSVSSVKSLTWCWHLSQLSFFFWTYQ